MDVWHKLRSFTKSWRSCLLLGNETYSPVVMEFTSAVTGANGCETLYEIRSRKLDTLCLPLALFPPIVAIPGMWKIFAGVCFLTKIDCIHLMYRVACTYAKVKVTFVQPIFTSIFRETDVKEGVTRRTSKYFDSIRILIWHVGTQASVHSQCWKSIHSLSVKRTKGRIFNFLTSIIYERSAEWQHNNFERV